MKQGNTHSISIIIPVLNEEAHIGKLLDILKHNCASKSIKEILVVDGGSLDQTVTIATAMGAKVLHSKKGRARQMNLGAQHANGTVLYFLHADTLPPDNYDDFILKAIVSGAKAGSFRMKFDTDSRFLNFFAWMTRMNFKICRGGDQSLFITKELFHKTKGFNEAYTIYEDSEFIGRLYKMTAFTILPNKVLTSARKYKKNGAVKLQYHFGVIHLKNSLGAGPDELYQYYKQNITV